MQKIKLKIGNSVYPLTAQLEQEEGLRNASKKIDVMIKHFEEKYAVKDKQDALAMCALQLATQSEQENISEAKINEEVGNRLETLNKSVNEIINL